MSPRPAGTLVSVATIDEVLAFWFGDTTATSAAELGVKMKRWYMGGEAEDAAIRGRFAEAVEQALAGELDAWAETPRGRLALILLLDQMTRSLFRGTSRAFAGDARAQELAVEMLEAGTAGELTFEERHFVFMPLLHAEDAGLLDRFNDLFPRSLESVPTWGRPLLGDGIEQGLKYRDVFRRFGRFPHRNEALGRRSTPEEVEFLKTWEERRAPKEFSKLPG
jgi:uncharacterized protein (DUF924 family)